MPLSPRPPPAQAPLAYQWRFNASILSGATASAYTRTNAQPADAGSYLVVVSNSAGTATSSNATLSLIVPAPTLVMQSPQVLQWQGLSNLALQSPGQDQPPGHQLVHPGHRLRSRHQHLLHQSGRRPATVLPRDLSLITLSTRLTTSPAFSRVFSRWPAFASFASRSTFPVSASIVIE